MHHAADSALVLRTPYNVGAVPGRGDEKLQEEWRTLPPPSVVRSSRHRENYGGQAIGEQAHRTAVLLLPVLSRQRSQNHTVLSNPKGCLLVFFAVR